MHAAHQPPTAQLESLPGRYPPAVETAVPAAASVPQASSLQNTRPTAPLTTVNRVIRAYETPPLYRGLVSYSSCYNFCTVRNQTHIAVDLLAIGISITIAVGLIYTGTLHSLLTSTAESRILGSLIAGLFFTSVFTTAPAIVALGDIALTNSIFATALIGAIGSVIGDLILFRFVRDRLAQDLIEVIKAKRHRRLPAIFRNRMFRRFSMFLGALIIASPLPDELGLMMMGLPNMPLRYFIPISYSMNALGIAIIGLIARAII